MYPHQQSLLGTKPGRREKDLSPTAATRRLRRAYLMALVALALLAASGQVLVQGSLNDQAGDTRLINLAGLQRSRSERLVKDLLTTSLFPSAGPTALTRLSATLSDFKQAQRSLVEGDARRDLASVSDPELLDQFADVDVEIETLVEAIEATMAANEVGEDPSPHLFATLISQQRFFIEMNDLVKQLDEASAAKVARMRILEISLFGVTIVALIGLGVGIFRPALRRLGRSVQLFEALSTNSPEALFLADGTGQVFHHNPAAEELLDGPVTGALYVADMLHDAEVPAVGSPTVSLAELQRPGGGTLAVRVKSTSIAINGDDTAHLLLIHDRSEELASEGRQRQNEKLEAIGVLAAGIAHEINTPTQFVRDNLSFIDESVADLMRVTTLLGAAVSQASEAGDGDDRHNLPESLQGLEGLLAEIDVEFIEEELASSIEQSMDGMNRVAEIVRAMKDFSHPGSNSREAADINEALTTTSVVCRSEWRHAAELELELDRDLPTVPVRLGDIKQVFLNLIVNAAHAIGDQPDSGTGLITIRTFLERDHAVVEIIDNGPGIPEANRDRIFEPFFTTKEVGRGTGQGLAICRRVVEEGHGGVLELDRPAEGPGTVFRIRLPRLIGDGRADMASDEAPSPALIEA